MDQKNAKTSYERSADVQRWLKQQLEDDGQPEFTPTFLAVLRNIELFLACDRVHGDLSEYNILYWQGTAVVIDFAQAVDPRYNLDAVFTLLERDIARVCRCFARYGVEADAGALAIDLWTRCLTGALVS